MQEVHSSASVGFSFRPLHRFRTGHSFGVAHGSLPDMQIVQKASRAICCELCMGGLLRERDSRGDGVGNVSAVPAEGVVAQSHCPIRAEGVGVQDHLRVPVLAARCVRGLCRVQHALRLQAGVAGVVPPACMRLPVQM